MTLAFARTVALGFGLAIVGCADLADDPSESGPLATKASEPETNLRDYPKLEGKTDGVSPRGEPSLDVISVETNGSDTSITFYDPAPGTTPEALAESLRLGGKQDVRLVPHDGGGASNLGPNDCAYGSARAFSCPVSFWTNNGESHPVVVFNDHSGVQWPVSNAVFKWNQVLGIDSVYKYNTCSGSFPGAHCVNVYSGSYGLNGMIGLTTMTVSSSHQFKAGRIELNQSYDPSQYHFTRNAAATHELGHALGLDHNVYSGDVMYYIVGTREDIGGENNTLLHSIYSIPR